MQEIVPTSVVTNKPYTGKNGELLLAQTLKRGLTSPNWGTFDQWTQKGRAVKKGETSWVNINFPPNQPGGKFTQRAVFHQSQTYETTKTTTTQSNTLKQEDDSTPQVVSRLLH
jgi:hypothetical protein